MQTQTRCNIGDVVQSYGNLYTVTHKTTTHADLADEGYDLPDQDNYADQPDSWVGLIDFNGYRLGIHINEIA